MRVVLFCSAFVLVAADWPAWRGQGQQGSVKEENYPFHWSASKNIRWKVELPGAGNSSPIVWRDQVIVTASEGLTHSRLLVLSFDRQTGKRRWATRLFATPAPAPFSLFPPERGQAAPTPATDGRHLIALFGTGDLVCLDLQGNPLWLRSLGTEYRPFRNDYGIAASPILVDDLGLVQIDHAEGSYLLAFELATGKTRWKTSRAVYDNWSTPVLAEVNQQRQVICLGTYTIQGYDLKTGKELWSLDGVERLCATTPIVRGTRLYVTSGPNGANLAIELSSRPKPQVLWESKKTGPFIPSPIVVGSLYLVCDDQGILRCLDADSGEEKWTRRLNTGRQRPSPVAAGNKLYFTSLNGTTVVLRAGTDYQELARNQLGEDIAASPALADGCLYFRGAKSLFCIAEDRGHRP